MKIEKWTILSEESLVKTPIFVLHQVEAQSQLDEQKKGKFVYFDVPAWVNVIALTKDRKVILVEQYRHGNREICLEIPGGMVDEGEDPLAAGLRELKEEAGGIGEQAELIGVVDPNPAIQNNSCWTVLIHNVELFEQELDPMEEIAIHLVDLEEIPDMIRSGKIRHSLVVAAFHHLHLWQTKNL